MQKILRTIQAVNIKMKKIRHFFSGHMLENQRIRRAGDIGRKAESFRYPPGQNGLPRSEISVENDDVTGQKNRSKMFPETLRRFR